MVYINFDTTVTNNTRPTTSSNSNFCVSRKSSSRSLSAPSDHCDCFSFSATASPQRQGEATPIPAFLCPPFRHRHNSLYSSSPSSSEQATSLRHAYISSNDHPSRSSSSSSSLSSFPSTSSIGGEDSEEMVEEPTRPTTGKVVGGRGSIFPSAVRVSPTISSFPVENLDTIIVNNASTVSIDQEKYECLHRGQPIDIRTSVKHVEKETQSSNSFVGVMPSKLQFSVLKSEESCGTLDPDGIRRFNYRMVLCRGVEVLVDGWAATVEEVYHEDDTVMVKYLMAICLRRSQQYHRVPLTSIRAPFVDSFNHDLQTSLNSLREGLVFENFYESTSSWFGGLCPALPIANFF